MCDTCVIESACLSTTSTITGVSIYSRITHKVLRLFLSYGFVARKEKRNGGSKWLSKSGRNEHFGIML